MPSTEDPTRIPRLDVTSVSLLVSDPLFGVARRLAWERVSWRVWRLFQRVGHEDADDRVTDLFAA